MRIVSGASTDTGQVRDGNEDSYLVDRQLELFAVADGMGGHRAGEVASETALAGFRAAIAEGVEVADAVGRANTAVWDKAAGDTNLAGMGTTLTAARFDGATLTIGHVGDSRAYLLREDRIDRLTMDHSLVEELIREGKITEEQAAVHPQRSIITRALGVDSSVDVDVYSVVLQPDDRVILCSDGLTSMVRPAAIAEIVRNESDPTAAANALVDAANTAGGDDNITVVVLDAQADGRDPLPDSVAAAITGGRGRNAPADAGDDGAREAEVVEPPAVTVVTETTSRDAAAGPPPESLAPLPPRDTAEFREPRPRRSVGRTIGRVLLFAIPILLIFGIAGFTIGWYARNSYFVGTEAGKVVVYRGRPGGMLFWDPTVAQRTGIARTRLTDDFRQGVSEHKEFSSEAAAVAYVHRGVTTTTTTSTTTSTTLPGVAPATPSPAP